MTHCPTGVSEVHDDDTVTLLCHEDDHSCYADFVNPIEEETDE